MKKIISLTVFSLAVLMLTGCYTQIATSNNDEEYTEGPIIIVLPAPQPIGFFPEPIPPSNNPPMQKEKIRKPVPPPPVIDSNTKDRLRNSGGRKNTGQRDKR